MSHSTVPAVARAALISSWLLVLYFSSAGCRPTICANSEGCLELHISAPAEFKASGELEVVLLGNTCNVLGIYKPTEDAFPWTSTGLVEVRYEVNGTESPTRIVVTAWPEGGGLPWSSAMQAADMYHLQLHPAVTAQKNVKSVPLDDMDSVEQLLAVTDKKEIQLISYLKSKKIGAFAVKADSFEPLNLPVETPSFDDLSFLSGTIIDKKLEFSFINNEISPVLKIGEFAQSKLTETCGSSLAIKLDAGYNFGIAIGQSKYLFIPDTLRELHAGSRDGCAAIVTKSLSLISPPSGIKPMKPSLSDVYPKSGPTAKVAVISDDSLRVIDVTSPSMFAQRSFYSLSSSERAKIISLAFIDMDRDTQPEIVVGTADGDLMIFQQKDDMLTHPNSRRIDTIIQNVEDMRLGDFNGDTLIDVAARVGDHVRIFFADGKGHFIESQVTDYGSVTAMDVADLNAMAFDHGCSDELISATPASIDIHSVIP